MAVSETWVLLPILGLLVSEHGVHSLSTSHDTIGAGVYGAAVDVVVSGTGVQEGDRILWVPSTETDCSSVDLEMESDAVMLNGDLVGNFNLEPGSYKMCYAPSGSHNSCRHLQLSGSSSSGLYAITTRDSSTVLQVECDMSTDGGGWTKVFYQDSGAGGSWVENAASMNIEQPEGDMYAILDYLEEFRGEDGAFEMYIHWPDDNTWTKKNRWRQTSNPIEQDYNEEVEGFEGIAIEYNYENEQFGGLQRNYPQVSLLDGQPEPVGSWHFAVGTVSLQPGNSFPGPRIPPLATRVELYVRDFPWIFEDVDMSVLACPGGVTPCNGKGTCEGDGTCTCIFGWWGEDCSNECPGGSSHPCNDAGTCESDGTCDCNTNYFGDECEFGIFALALFESSVLAAPEATEFEVPYLGTGLAAGDRAAWVDQGETDCSSLGVSDGSDVGSALSSVHSFERGNFKLCYKFSNLVPEAWRIFSDLSIVARGKLDGVVASVIDSTSSTGISNMEFRESTQMRMMVDNQMEFSVFGHGISSDDQLILVPVTSDPSSCDVGDFDGVPTGTIHPVDKTADYELTESRAGDYFVCYKFDVDGWDPVLYTDYTIIVSEITGVSPEITIAFEVVDIVFEGYQIVDGDEAKFTRGDGCEGDAMASGVISNSEVTSSLFSLHGTWRLCYKLEGRLDWIFLDEFEIVVNEDLTGECILPFQQLSTHEENPASYYRSSGYEPRPCQLDFRPPSEKLGGRDDVTIFELFFESLDLNCINGHQAILYELPLDAAEGEEGQVELWRGCSQPPEEENHFVSSAGHFLQLQLDVNVDTPTTSNTHKGIKVHYFVKPVLISMSPRESLYREDVEVTVSGFFLDTPFASCHLAPTPYPEESDAFPLVVDSSLETLICRIPGLAEPPEKLEYLLQVSNNGRDFFPKEGDSRSSSFSYALFEEKCHGHTEVSKGFGVIRDKAPNVRADETAECTWNMVANFTTQSGTSQVVEETHLYIVYDFGTFSCQEIALQVEFVGVNGNPTSLTLCGGSVPMGCQALDHEDEDGIETTGYSALATYPDREWTLCHIVAVNSTVLDVSYNVLDESSQSTNFLAFQVSKPIISDVFPLEGMFNEAHTITITGFAFSEASRCMVGDFVVTTNLMSSTNITCEVPPLPWGVYRISVGVFPTSFPTGQAEDEPVTLAVSSFEFNFMPCAAGEFAETERHSCQQCAAGFYADVGATTCSKCPVGQFNSLIGQSACEDCKPGSFRDATVDPATCQFCPSPHYQDEYGQTRCKSCAGTELATEDHYITLPMLEGAASVGNCKCSQGYFDDNFGVGNTLCVDCPDVADCRDRNPATYQIMPTPAVGHFAVANSQPHNPYKFMLCIPEVACLGGVGNPCTEGYQGFLCGQCAQGYFELEGLCEKCTGAVREGMIAAYFIVGLVFLIVLSAIALYRKPVSKTAVSFVSFTGAIAITVGYAQVTVLFGSFNIPWPDNVKTWLTIASFVNFNAELAQPECQFPDVTFLQKWNFTMLLPLFVAFSFITIGLVLILSLRIWSQRRLEAAKVANPHMRKKVAPKLRESNLSLDEIEVHDSPHLYRQLSTSLPDTPRSPTAFSTHTPKLQPAVVPDEDVLTASPRPQRSNSTDKSPRSNISSPSSSQPPSPTMKPNGSPPTTKKQMSPRSPSKVTPSGLIRKTLALKQYDGIADDSPPLPVGHRHDSARPNVVVNENTTLGELREMLKESCGLQSLTTLGFEQVQGDASSYVVTSHNQSNLGAGVVEATFRSENLDRSQDFDAMSQASSYMTRTLESSVGMIATQPKHQMARAKALVGAMRREAEEAGEKRFSLAWGWVYDTSGQEITEQTLREEEALIRVKIMLSMQNAFFMFLSLVYLTLARRAFEIFDCTYTPEGVLILEVDTRIECSLSDPNYSYLFPRAILCSLSYGIGIPCALFWILWRNRFHLSDERKFYRFGFLFEKYQAKWYYWEIVVMAKKFLLVLVHRFLTKRPLFQVIGGLGVIFMAIVVHLLAKPFKLHFHDMMEFGLLLCNFLIMFTGLLFLSDKFPDQEDIDWRAVFGVFAILIFVSGLLLVFLAVALSLITGSKKRKTAKDSIIGEIEGQMVFESVAEKTGRALFEFFEKTVSERDLPQYLHWIYLRAVCGTPTDYSTLIDLARFYLSEPPLSQTDALMLVKVARRALENNPEIPFDFEKKSSKPEKFVRKMKSVAAMLRSRSSTPIQSMPESDNPDNSDDRTGVATPMSSAGPMSSARLPSSDGAERRPSLLDLVRNPETPVYQGGRRGSISLSEQLARFNKGGDGMSQSVGPSTSNEENGEGNEQEEPTTWLGKALKFFKHDKSDTESVSSYDLDSDSGNEI